MRSQVWNHLGTRMEMVGNAFYMVGVHHTLHHFLVHCKWHVNFGTFDHGRPMLVAYGMSQFNTDACNVSPVFRSQSRQVDNEYWTQFDSDNDSFLRFGMIVYDVTIVHFLVTLQGNGVFLSVGIGGYKPALLCGPLVEDQFNPFQSFQSLFPFRVVDISYDFFINSHGCVVCIIITFSLRVILFPFVILNVVKDLFTFTLCLQILRHFVPQDDKVWKG